MTNMQVEFDKAYIEFEIDGSSITPKRYVVSNGKIEYSEEEHPPILPRI